MTIKQFFYQPADGVWGNYDITPVGYWMIEAKSDNKNYKKSTIYKWLKTNCTGRWDIAEYMLECKPEYLFIDMYDQADAAAFSLHHNVSMPAAYELELELDL